MSELLRVLENEVQIAALLFMAAVYTVRLVWLFRFRSRKERASAEGSEGAGIGRSLLNIARPRDAESSRTKPGLYIQFVVFHLGVAVAIAATFIIPYAPAYPREPGRGPFLPGADRSGPRRRPHAACPEAPESGPQGRQHPRRLLRPSS